MRILLAANASYEPPRGGATRSNLVWLEHLASAGHTGRVISAAQPSGSQIFERSGIQICALLKRARQAEVLRQQIREFQPDWVLVSSEDLGHVLLREAQRSAPGRVVYLAHTPQFFPFGPASWNSDAGAAELVARSAGVVAIGHHTADYIRRYTGREATVIHPPIYGRGPFANLASFDAGLITMVNPCAIKGISIFLALAERFPQSSFGALPGWGTTAADRAQLASHANVTVLPPCRDIAEFLSRTRVLLMPSLWYEGFGLIVMEAMLHGIPVIASDAGGLVEAKMGTPFVVPVRGIQRYEPVFDEHALPKAVIEPVDRQPWAAALDALLTDRTLYEQVSTASREAAVDFVRRLDAGRMLEFLQSLTPRAAGPAPMRILLAQNAQYYPAHGGGDRSNRLLMEALAARGHACRAVARLSRFGPAAHQQYLRDLAARAVSPVTAEGGVVVFQHAGVEAHVVTDHPNLRAWFAAQIAEFAPDVILASTDDPAQLLLEAALRARVRTVYLARATLALPFGPDCAFPSAAKTEMLRQCDAVVGVSQYVADYIRRWSGISAVHVPISLMDPPPYADLGRFDNEFVTLVNPCAVKGVPIFLELADRMPGVRFLAVPTWGTNLADRAALARRTNVTVLNPVDNIDEILRRTRVLLVPSLWAEARSRMVVDALLRGVPVVASNMGGIPEAMLGVDYLLPVRPIERYQPQVDEQMVPVAEVPPQDIGPWETALHQLLSDRALYEALARTSRQAALAYAEGLSVRPCEALLEDVAAKPRAEPAPRPSALGRLSPERRKLLALRMRKMLHLFCFPHAGGGPIAFKGWAERLPRSIAVFPLRTPSRSNMAELVEALHESIEPHLDEPFAFFGHSMGAAVAFELARLLRRRGQPLPRMLLVSGARAPQFRRGHVPPPEPSEAEFISALRRLEGTPPDVLDNPNLMSLILPAVRADAAIYRQYTYTDEPPLECPIRAYGGTEDPNVSREQLAAWAQQTSASFGLRLFRGGHFFLQTGRAEFLAALGEDLTTP